VGKLSRNKGAEGEREVVRLATGFAVRAERTAQLQANPNGSEKSDVRFLDYPHLHIEVKRDNTKSVDAMVRQAMKDKHPTEEAVVIWRRDRAAWRVDISPELFFDLLIRAEA